MLRHTLVLAVLAAGSCGLAMARDVAGTQGAGKGDEVTITVEENGKTVKAVVGQAIVVALEGKEAGTGWEAGGGEGTSVAAEKGGGSVGQYKITAREFVAAKDAVDGAIGTYTFRYKAVAAGKTTLEYSYVSPGGPLPIVRSATKLVGRMKVVIEVAGK